METIINIGLNTNKEGKVNKDRLLKDISSYLTTFKTKIRRSNTERTLIVSTKEFISNFQIQKLCDDNDQDCIAVMRDDKGALVYGSHPLNDWGEFNEKYFIR